MRTWHLSKPGSSNLCLVERQKPTPQRGEVLIRVGAVALNYRDLLIIDGQFGELGHHPFVPGSDMAGEVIALGDDVTRFKVGDLVVGCFYPFWLEGSSPPLTPSGSRGSQLPGVLTEYLTTSAEGLARAPIGMTAIEACTLPCAGLTAWSALVENGKLRAGQTVVVQGTGGVSLFALQIAVGLGAQVIVTSSSDDKLERARRLGALHVINYRSRPEWGQDVVDATGGRGAAHVVEVVGGDLTQSITALEPGGRISLIGILAGTESRIPAVRAVVKQAILQGILVGHRKGLEALVSFVERNQLRPVIDNCFGFSDLPTALKNLRQGPFGKVVIATGV